MSRSIRHVIITGASGRLGRTLTRSFEGEGIRVTAIDKEEPTASSTRNLSADVTDEADVRRVFTAAAASSAPDVLIHAVGMWGETPVAEASLDDWRTMMDVNLTSAFLCFREALRVMPDGGSIIAFASGQGADRAAPRQAAYSAAKAGIVRLVEATDAETRERDIRAFAIAPSMILFGDDVGKGVHETELAGICRFLLSDAGRALGGSVVRAYGQF